MNKIQCGQCGGTAVTSVRGPYKFFFGPEQDGIQLEVEVPYRNCTNCGFRFLDSEADDIVHARICRHLGIMTPEEVAAVRQRYELTRKEFSVVTRIGEASIGRWESGALFQGEALDNYLYLLTFPANMDRLRHRDVHTPVVLVGPAREIRGHWKALTDDGAARHRQAALAFHLRLP